MGRPGKYLLDLNPIYFRLPLPNVGDNRFKLSRKMVNAKKIYKNKIINPKSIALNEDQQQFFTGSSDGNIYCVDMENNTTNIVASFINGRPLGMRLFRNVLYFIEAKSGLYSYDLNSKSLQHLLALSETKFLNGKTSKFFDDLVVTEENDEIIIYITDVSRKFSIDMWCYVYFEPDSTGRILRFNINNNSVTTIMDNLYFPNGIEITDDNESLLICELTKRRILQYKLKGPKIGSISILMDNLPGEPENIRRSCNKSEETYWVGLALTRDHRQPSFLDNYSTEPSLRKFILRSCFLLGTIMYNIGVHFNSDILINKGFYLKSGMVLILYDFANYPGMAIEINLHSDVLLSFQIEDDTSLISEIAELSSPKTSDDGSRILYTTSSGGSLSRIVLNKTN